MHRAQAVHESGSSGFGKYQLSEAGLCNSAQTLSDWVVDDDTFMRGDAQIAMYGIANDKRLAQFECRKSSLVVSLSGRCFDKKEIPFRGDVR